jgi:predicted phosphodiesterase
MFIEGMVIVRLFCKILYGINDVTRTAKNYKRRRKVEEILAQWVINSNNILIAGHNHRPYFPEIGNPPYFNDGSCVYPR